MNSLSIEGFGMHGYWSVAGWMHAMSFPIPCQDFQMAVWKYAMSFSVPCQDVQIAVWMFCHVSLSSSQGLLFGQK